jgi:hypothetical protein
LAKFCFIVLLLLLLLRLLLLMMIRESKLFFENIFARELF